VPAFRGKIPARAGARHVPVRREGRAGCASPKVARPLRWVTLRGSNRADGEAKHSPGCERQASEARAPTRATVDHFPSSSAHPVLAHEPPPFRIMQRPKAHMRTHGAAEMRSGATPTATSHPHPKKRPKPTAASARAIATTHRRRAVIHPPTRETASKIARDCGALRSVETAGFLGFVARGRRAGMGASTFKTGAFIR
jgi:hypothetical protein